MRTPLPGALSTVLTQGSHKSREYIKKVSTKKKDILRTGKLTNEYIELYLNQRFKANESLDKILMQYEFYKKHLKSDSRITFLEVVDKGDIESVYNRIKDISPVDADECILTLYNFFNWCELNGYREKNTNPCSDIKENISYSINKNSVIYSRKTQNEYRAA